MMIKLDTECIKYIGLFESLTGVVVKDCIVNGTKIMFIVKEGQAGIAIGKEGVNIKNLQNKINKKIEVIEFSQDPTKFITNIFRPMVASNAYISERSDNKKILRFDLVRPNNTQILINIKARLKKAKYLIKKYFDIDEAIIS